MPDTASGFRVRFAHDLSPSGERGAAILAWPGDGQLANLIAEAGDRHKDRVGRAFCTQVRRRSAGRRHPAGRRAAARAWRCPRAIRAACSAGRSGGRRQCCARSRGAARRGTARRGGGGRGAPQFAHDLYREVVAGELTAAPSTEINLALGRALLGRPGPVARVAAHLRRPATPGAPRRSKPNGPRSFMSWPPGAHTGLGRQAAGNTANRQRVHWAARSCESGRS